MMSAQHRRVHPYVRAAQQAVRDKKRFTGAHLNLRDLDKPPYALRDNLEALRPCAGTEYHLLSCGLLIATPHHIEPCGQTCFWKASAGERDPSPFTCFDCRMDLQQRYEMGFPIVKELGESKAPRFSWVENLLGEEKQYPDTPEYREVRSKCVNHEITLMTHLRDCYRIVDFNDLCDEVRERKQNGSLTGEGYEKLHPYGHINWDLLPNQRGLLDYALYLMRIGRLSEPSSGDVKPTTPGPIQKPPSNLSQSSIQPALQSHTKPAVNLPVAAVSHRIINPAPHTRTYPSLPLLHNSTQSEHRYTLPEPSTPPPTTDPESSTPPLLSPWRPLALPPRMPTAPAQSSTTHPGLAPSSPQTGPHAPSSIAGTETNPSAAAAAAPSPPPPPSSQNPSVSSLLRHLLLGAPCADDANAEQEPRCLPTAPSAKRRRSMSEDGDDGGRAGKKRKVGDAEGAE